jgi:acyl-CoA thioesterase-2
MCVSSSRRRAAARPQRPGFYFPIDRSASDGYRARPVSRPEVLSIASELALEAVAPDVYVGASALEEGRVFGGLMIAHALRAAHATVPDDRIAHSLQCAFVRAGRNDESLRYEVERTHEGASFSTRRVVVHQAGAVAFVLTARFQVAEDGPEYQPAAGPTGPRPEELPVGRYDSPWFESRDVPPDAPGHPAHARAAWFRCRTVLPDDAAMQQHALAFLTDHGPTRAVRQPHLDDYDTERRISVSLDHAVWFHRPARVEEWLLYELVPASTSGGRGLALGTVRTAGGDLVATVAQEALLRMLG